MLAPGCAHATVNTLPESSLAVAKENTVKPLEVGGLRVEGGVLDE